ncbi:Protein kinase-like domain containing protein [Rhypophila decipiens]
MPAPNQAEEDAIAAGIIQELSKTRYACSSVTQLTGGTVNFVYRGTLTQPLSWPDADDGGPTKTTVIIKHSTDFVAINKDFPLDVTRCTFEESMLDAVAAFHPHINGDDVIIKTPRLYLFDRQTNTQVIEDLVDTADLKSVFFQDPDARSLRFGLGPSAALAIGRHLGSWLRSFHDWASIPEQAGVRTSVGENRPIRDLKRMVTYDGVLAVLRNYPDELLGDEIEATLQIIVDGMGREFGKPLPKENEPLEDGWGLIHGDYWSGNVLLPNNSPWKEKPGSGGANKLFIIDWEFAQYGHKAYDLGQMIGDLWERNIFNGVDIVMPVLKGLLEGYGEVSEDMAFRAAMHAGTQLVGWYNRRPRTGALVAPREVIVEGLTIGRDLILKGWEKDRKHFQGERSVLAALFPSSR